MARIGLVTASLAAAALMTGAQAEEGELVKSFLSALGVVDQDKEAIDYRERPPLVLPPRMELRDPAAPGGAQARNPQWPNDPDVMARKRQAAQDSLPITETDQYRMNSQNSRLSVDEIRAGRHAGAALPTTVVAPRTDANWVHPDVLRAQDHRRGIPTKAADNTSGRRSLTEPPSAYRQSATGQPIKGSFDVPER